MITYQMYPPEGILREFVRFFWSLETQVDRMHPFVHRTLPDNCMELIFYCKGKLSINSSAGYEGHTFTSGIYGQSHKFRQFSTTEDFALFGVYLYPYTPRVLFNFPAADLFNEKADSETLWGMDGKVLEEKVYSASSHTERTRVVSDFLLKKIEGVRHHDLSFGQRIQSMVNGNIVQSISSAASECNLSRRQFERKLSDFAGLSPKDFFSLNRFKRAIHQIEGGNHSLAQVAIDAGYYDQSHFTNEFKSLSGYTPKVFLLNLQPGADHRVTRDFQE